MSTAFFLSSGPPFPEVGSRRIRDQQILHLLAQRFDHVEAVCTGNIADLERFRAESREEFGSKVNLSLFSSSSRTIASKGIDFVRPHFAKGHHSSITSYLRSNAKRGDLLWASRLRMAKYLPLGRELGCTTVLDEHQVESDLLFDNAFSSMRYWYQGVEALRCAFYERKICEEAHIVIAGAEIDFPRMKRLNPDARVKVLPYSVDPRDYKLPGVPETDPPTVMLIGDLDYEPAVHSIHWLAEQVFPRLEAALGDQCPKFLVATSYIPEGIQEKFPTIEFHRLRSRGDLLEQMARSRLAVFPLRYGRGNRINLLEAMAAGMPIIATGKAADGVPVVPTRDFMMADEEDDFTSAILRLLRDDSERERLGAAACQMAQSIYSVDDDLERFDEILRAL